MSRRMRPWSVLCIVGMVTSAKAQAQGVLPPPAEAMLAPTESAPARADESGADTWRAMLYLALGGGGNADVEIDPASPLLGDGYSVDNRVSAGAGLRVEHPLGGFLVLGAQAELLSYELAGGERDIGGHVGVWVKGRQIHRYNARVEQESYLGVPVGFSILRFEENLLLKRETNSLGWNIGALVGIQLIVDGRYGTLIELGWRRIEVYNEEVATGSNLSTATNQFAFNAGYALHF